MGPSRRYSSRWGSALEETGRPPTPSFGHEVKGFVSLRAACYDVVAHNKSNWANRPWTWNLQNHGQNKLFLFVSSVFQALVTVNEKLTHILYFNFIMTSISTK